MKVIQQTSWRFALFAGSLSSMVEKFSLLSTSSIFCVRQCRENRVVPYGFPLYITSCIIMLIVQINAKVRYSYLVLIITDNLHNKCTGWRLKRQAYFIHEINRKTNRWTFERIQWDFIKKNIYALLTNQSFIVSQDICGLFFLSYNKYTFFFSFFFSLWANFYSCVLFPSVMYPWIITVKVYSRLNRSVVFKSFIALIKCLMSKMSDARKRRKIRIRAHNRSRPE